LTARHAATLIAFHAWDAAGAVRRPYIAELAWDRDVPRVVLG